MISELSDPFIHDLIERFGARGYMVYFRTLAMMGHEYRPETPGVLKTNWKQIQYIMRLRQKTLQKILFFISEKMKFSIEENGDEIIITCPNFRKYADDYTMRKIAKTPDTQRAKVRSDSGVSTCRIDKNRLDISSYRPSSLQVREEKEIVDNSVENSRKSLKTNNRSTGTTRLRRSGLRGFLRIDAILQRMKQKRKEQK